MRIQHNIMAMNAYRNYNNNTSALAKNLEKLSSGYRINRAGDDAAGLAISEKMRAQITGLTQAQSNAKSGINLIQTAEGALQEVHSMLNRMVTLADQSANGTYDNEVDRVQLQKEIKQLSTEIDRIADASNFNGIKLLDGTLGMNTKAFDVKGAVDAAGAAEVAGAVGALLPEGNVEGTNTILHKAGTDAAAGKFTIDLSQLSASVTDATKTASVDLKINGKTYTITADNAGDSLTADEIATKLAAKINEDNTNKGMLVGSADNKGLIYEATANADGSGTITFNSKYDGQGNALTDGKPLDTTEDANLGVEFTVEIAGTNTDTTLTGAENVRTTNRSAAVKNKAATFGNTMIDFDVTKIKEGMTLKIGSEEHTFGDDDIKVSDLDLTKADDVKTLQDRITQAFSGNTDVSVGFDNATGKMTLAEKVDPTTKKSTASEDAQKMMSDMATFKNMVSLTTPATTVGTELSVKNGEVKEGNTLTIDGKQYQFTNDKSKLGTSGNVTYVEIGTDAKANLQKALEEADYVVSTKGDNLVIHAKPTTDGSDPVAPQILGKGLTLQIGDTSDDYNQLTVSLQDMHAADLGIGEIDISNQDGAAAAVDKIKNAINMVSDVRGTLGATQNRLDHTINNLSVMTENIQDAESTIRDTDVAAEMMAYTKNNILIQSAQAMLAQANQVPQGVLQLLQ